MVQDKEQTAVRSVLQRFQDGYTARDTDALDQFLADLWVTDEEQFIVGTGHGEWSFGPAEVRRLIELDWLHWGDMVLDVSNAGIAVFDEVAWLSTSGTVSKQGDADKDCEGLLTITKDDLNSDLPGYRKLLFLNAGISQPLWELARGTEFVWPVRFSASLVKRAGKWLFNSMHFSFDTSDYPDSRLGVAKVEPWDIDQVQHKLAGKVKQHCTAGHEDVRSLLEALGTAFTTQDGERLYSLLGDQPVFIGTAPSQRATGVDEVVNAMLTQATQDRFWGELTLNAADALVYSSDDVAWIGAIGTAKRTITAAEVYEAHIQRIQQLMDSELSVQAKLLGIVRHNSFTLMELEKGELNVWPVRLSAVAVKTGNCWRFQQLHFSYPTVWGSDERILP